MFVIERTQAHGKNFVPAWVMSEYARENADEGAEYFTENGAGVLRVYGTEWIYSRYEIEQTDERHERVKIYLTERTTAPRPLTESDEEIINNAIWWAEHSKKGLTLENVVEWLKVNFCGFLSARNLYAVEHYIDATLANMRRA